MRGIHWRPVNSQHKWPAMRKMFQSDDVIMSTTDRRLGRSYNKKSYRILKRSPEKWCSWSQFFAFQAKRVKIRQNKIYRQTSNISRPLVGNKVVEHFRCSWSIAWRHCSNYIFILDLTPGFNGLGKYNCKTRRETFQLWGLVGLILESWRLDKCLFNAALTTNNNYLPREL